MIKLLFFIMARWVSVLTCNSHNPRFVCFSSKIDRINMVMMMVLLFDCCVGACYRLAVVPRWVVVRHAAAIFTPVRRHVVCVD